MDNPIRLHWLDPRNANQPFPPAHLAMRDPNGLLAIGGDLSVSRLLRAYAQGIFPWYNPDEPILWWCPDPRAILQPGEFHVSRSLRKSIRRGDYAISFDRAFAQVLEECAASRGTSRGTWLGADMKRAYLDLHLAGHAHSVEVWREGGLVGGLYGVALGRAYFGESMFSRVDDGSKIAMYWLVEHLKSWSFDILDCQIASNHLETLGARELPRDEFLRRLAKAVALEGRRGSWRLDVGVPADARHLPRLF